jgi:pectinesterase
MPPDQFRPANGERPSSTRPARRAWTCGLPGPGPEPLAAGDPGRPHLAPGITVAPDGSGSHRSLQAAIDAVPLRAANKPARVVIQLRPGVYRERVCVSAGKAPITLLGDPADPSAVIIIGNAYGGQAKRAGVDIAHPCQPDLALPIVGTLGSATMIVAAATSRPRT